MKADAIQQEPTFKPVTLTITFESQKELDSFASMCNCLPIVETMIRFQVNLRTLREALRDVINYHAAPEAIMTQLRKQLNLL